MYGDGMTKLKGQIDTIQKTVCNQYAAEYVPAHDEAKTGFALSTKGLITINGLRHPVSDDMSGWYIWCGEVFSESSDFFSPLHTYHIHEDYPEIGCLLGLPPGYRFLLAGDYPDVWYDACLLNV
jgi:hypothetical protein